MHPAIRQLDAHWRDIQKMRQWLGGADFADERGWLKGDELDRFERQKRLFHWDVLEFHDHEDRVRTDHPKEYEAWRKRQRREARPLPRWRLDKIEHPRGDLFEMELRVTWRVIEIATERLVLELEGCEDLDYSGPGWTPRGGSGAARVGILHDEAHVLRADGTEEKIPLK